MKSYKIDLIQKYLNLINNEIYDNIIYEMIYDLKNMLIDNLDTDSNYKILQEFVDITTTNYNEKLNNLIQFFVINEGVDVDISRSISNMKSGFTSKHTKIVARDKKWLKTNKKTLLTLDCETIEIEIVNDYKTSFEQLIRRHNIFDSLFVNSSNRDELPEKLRRFEDKNQNLKNGLDNYFRTGTSRREVGLKKIAGEEVRTAIEYMIEYCESFINGRQFLEEKMNNIIVAVSDSKIEESVLFMLKETKDFDKAMDKMKDDNKDEVDMDADTDEEIEDNEPEENKKEEPPVNNPQPQRGIRDRQTGVAVLLTVAEARYFDYINVLKGLVEE